MEVDDSDCLRTQELEGRERLMTFDNAKDECSKNSRCIGIHYEKSHYECVMVNWQCSNIEAQFFKICLDAIYTSYYGKKDEDVAHKLVKKVASDGKNATHIANYISILPCVITTNLYQNIINVF